MAPIWRPRMRRIRSGGRLSMRLPSRRISPRAIRPGGSSRPMMAAPVMDLPAPDSPTTPSTSPGSMVKETPSSAVRVPRRVGNSTRRSRTSRRGGAMLPQLRIQGVAEPVAQQVDREDHRDEGGSREDGDPPLAAEEKIVADPDQRAERGLGRRHADAEEGERGLGEDGERSEEHTSELQSRQYLVCRLL